jgi:hypothetical protein
MSTPFVTMMATCRGRAPEGALQRTPARRRPAGRPQASREKPRAEAASLDPHEAASRSGAGAARRCPARRPRASREKPRTEAASLDPHEAVSRSGASAAQPRRRGNETRTTLLVCFIRLLRRCAHNLSPCTQAAARAPEADGARLRARTSWGSVCGSAPASNTGPRAAGPCRFSGAGPRRLSGAHTSSPCSGARQSSWRDHRWRC